MSRVKRKKLAPSEQHILEHGHVLLLTRPDDQAHCDELIVEHHYLKDATLVGEHLRYAFIYKGQWLAVATWGAAALHLKARDQFIGWTSEQCRLRRGLIANNTRLLVLPDCHYPNLISRFMKLMLARLPADWQDHWQHPVALVETFVDPQLYQGTAYKVSGWCQLGRTAGWKRDATDYYVKHDRPKQIWVRELARRACQKLRAQKLPPEWASAESELAPRCTVKVPQIQSLVEHLMAEVPEFRRSQGRAYPVAGLVALVVMALATGVRKGPQDLALYADTLSQGQRRALRFRRDPKSREVRCPKTTVFQTLLTTVEAAALERAVLIWQNQLLGPAQDHVVLIDGKKMRGGGLEMVNATTGSGRFLGAVITPDKTNEITAARTVLKTLDLTGKIVVADALHTNAATAQQILYEQGGDYLMTVKGNQPDLHKILSNLFAQEDFSPSTDSAHPRGDTGTEPGPDRNPGAGRAGDRTDPGVLSRRSPGRASADPGFAQRRLD